MQDGSGHSIKRPLKRFRCYYGTIRKPCCTDLAAVESAILGHALEHMKTCHPRVAATWPDLEGRLQDEIEDDIDFHPAGAGSLLFACQDLSPTNLWRCKFVQLGSSRSELVKAAEEHFRKAHPRVEPDMAAIRASVRSSNSEKVSWDWAETPLHVRWAKP